MKHPQESPELLIFHGLDPELGQRSKNTHIALTITLSLLLLPTGAILFFVMGIFMNLISLGHLFPWLFLTTVTCALEVLTWFGLCLLFFKRNDPWWQRAVWSLCFTFGIITTAFATLCFLLFLSEGEDFIGLVVPFILTLSLFCLAQGYIHARRAHRSIKHITRLRHERLHPTA